MSGHANALALCEPDLTEADAQAVAACVRDGWISGIAQQVDAFESEFARFAGAPHAVATSSGTSALHLALAGLGIGTGDEVVVPSLTFIATANAVRYTGARVVLADVDPRTWTLAPDEIERRRTPRTRAVLPVHLAGEPADLAEVARAGRDAALIEDCAQAIGSTYRDEHVGRFGSAGCFSFFPNKVITTGEGGMVLVSDDALADRLRALRAHAKRPGARYVHDELGFNYRMTGIQAALGTSQLARIGALIEHRRGVARWYEERLRGSAFAPQGTRAGSMRTPSFFAVLAATAALRDRALGALAEARIEARPMFDPLHTQAPHRTEGAFPVTDDIAARAMFLPCGPRVLEDNVDRVVAELARVAHERSATR